MTGTTSQPIPTRQAGNLFGKLELDTRLLGMIGAFVILCIGFNFLTDGRFLTPRNIFNLTIQTVSVAIMACGMVFVIVNRHIDLSVGALLATTSAVMAMMQSQILPRTLGLGLGHPAIWALAVVSGLLVGTLIGAFQGRMIGYLTIPAFIVTLGGFLVWRNVAWYLTSGQTIGPLDGTFLIFGGTNGTPGQGRPRLSGQAALGGTALSGGFGTIRGAIFGALIMQALQSGMAMVGVDAPFQNIVVGSVLALAVFIDIIYRRRVGAK